jgi:Leucine-rich repeat (LRR) protein
VVTYTVSTGEGGTVEYKNTTLLSETTIQLPKGQDAVFSMKPEHYYVVDAVKLNGQTVTGNLDVNGNLTVKGVQADAKLEVSFRVNGEITVNMEDGTRLTNMLSEKQKQYVTKLTVKGQLWEEDFRTMRDEMPSLSVIDLWEAQVDYVPYQAFCTTQSWDGNSVGKKTLTSVRLPESVKGISGFAFAGCSNLKEVNFTALKNLEYMDSHAFESTSLPVIDLSNTKLTEVGDAFRNVKNLENIKFPETMTKLGGVFSKSSLTEMDLSGYTNLKTLEGTFSQCKSLTKVTLPEGLTTITNSAFYECTALATLNFPKSLQTIGGWTFYNTNLQKVDLSGLTELQSIGEYAFNNCHELTEVLFPASLEQLGNVAFGDCHYLTSVDLSKTQLQSIPERAFESCSVMESAKLPKTLETIESNAFAWSNNMGGVLELGPGFTSIGENAFAGTQISIVKSEATVPPVLNATAMPDAWVAAFVPEGCADAYKAAAVWEDKIILDKEVRAEVTVSNEGNLAIDINQQAGISPATITHLKVHGPLGPQDFAIMRSNMTLLYDLDMSDAQVSVISENAFLDKKVLMNVKLPASLLRIEQYAFRGCSSLKGTLALPNNLKFIGYAAFQGCSSLEKVVLNENLEVIQGYAFEGCSSLAQEISLPRDFQSLGERAFANCSSLYGTVKFNRDFYMFMGTEGFGSSAGSCFENCSSIETVDMSEPDFLDEIPYRTFAGCTSLATVLLPPILDRIDDEAFVDCSSLDGLEFPNTLRVINWSAFRNCTSLTSINLSDCKDLGTIEGYAFNGCSSLETAYLPKSLNWIREYAFADCRKLVNLTVEALQPADLGEYVFRHVHTDRCVLSIPTGTFYDYLSAAQWGEFVSMRKNIDVKVGEGANLYFLNRGPIASTRGTDAGLDGAKVKDGSSLYVQENEKAIFKIDPDENIQITKVLFNGKDVTKKMVNGTYETPGVTDASSFEVRVKVVGDIHVKELRMLDDEVAVKTGENRQLRFAVYPTNATNKNIEWTCSDKNVATVSKDGVITGKAPGRAEITAKTKDGGFEQKCKIVIMSNNYWIVMDDKVDNFVENDVTLPLALHNEGEARDIQFDVYMPEGVTMNDWCGDFGIELSERADGYNIAAARMSDGAVRVVVYSIDGKGFQENDGQLLTLPFTTGEDVGDFDVAIKNIHISGPDNFDFAAPNHTIRFNLKDYPVGDSNGDGSVTVNDAVITVDQILEQNFNRFVRRAADVNKDDQITVADVTGTIDIVLGVLPKSRAMSKGAFDAKGRLFVNVLQMKAGEQQTMGLQIENADDFIAFQCDISLPANMKVVRDENDRLMVGLSNGMTSSHAISANLLGNGDLRVVVISPQNEHLSLLGNDIVNLALMTDDSMTGDDVIDIHNIRLVRSDNSEYLASDASAFVRFSEEATAIENVWSYNGLDIRTENRHLIVDSPEATILQLVSADGISRNLQIHAGENRFFIESAGVYIIGGKKLFIK